jgi:citrate synthase
MLGAVVPVDGWFEAHWSNLDGREHACACYPWTTAGGSACTPRLSRSSSLACGKAPAPSLDATCPACPLAIRLTALGAPESLQGAVAAGLLGLGNTFVGTIEGAARLCQTRLPHGDEGELVPCTGSQIVVIATDVVAEAAQSHTPIVGIGHPVHKPVDPRAEKLCAISTELGFPTEPVRLMREISRQASEQRCKVLPLNATGAIGATSSQLGVPWDIARGLGVMARAIGLVGHLLEERRNPLAATVWTRAERESGGAEDAG